MCEVEAAEVFLSEWPAWAERLPGTRRHEPKDQRRPTVLWALKSGASGRSRGSAAKP